MTPAAAQAMVARLIVNGETVTLQRNIAGGPPLSVGVRARVTGYTPEELTDGIDQGARKVILLAADVAAAGFPGDPQPGDKVIVRGDMLNVEGSDVTTRSIAGVTVAYELRVLG